MENTAPNPSIRQIQTKILEIMAFVDELCRAHCIEYYIMGGTAIGAVRHRGFIPWDDDLDIFMTPDNYEKFAEAFLAEDDTGFVLQEWRLGRNPLEYAKVRMNGTTFIETNFRHNHDMHHGVYVDIMILHKCPENQIGQYILFLYSRYVVLQALAERNWIPKSRSQAIILRIVRSLPKHFLTNYCYRRIYRYDKQDMRGCRYCYFITPASFRQAVFPEEMFRQPVEVEFENVTLLAPTDIIGYLEIRYGDYMELPPEEKRKTAKHAEIVDLERDYREYV